METPGKGLAKDVAALKKMVHQQQLMISALLQGPMGPSRGGSAMTPSENSGGRSWENVDALQLRLIWLK